MRRRRRPRDLVAELAGRGVGRFVYTPVEVDGTLQGPGVEGLRAWPRRRLTPAPS